MHEIPVTQIPGIRIGQAEDPVGGTGVTVILAPEGMCAGLDVRGGGPASRESELLKPTANAESIHAVVLDGDSIYAPSVGRDEDKVEANINTVGTLAADVMAEAVPRAVLSAEGAYGRPAARDLPLSR